MYLPTDKVYIVATGWSLRGFNFDILKGKNVIGVNWACAFCECDYVVANDIEWIMKNDKGLIEHLAKQPVICHHNVTMPHPFELIVMESSGAEGFDFRPYRVKSAGNSGYTAINAAYHLGARNIYLLGYDLCADPNGEKYFHERTGRQGAHPDYMNMNYYYDIMADTLEDSDVKIYNCSDVSQLNAFERCTMPVV